MENKTVKTISKAHKNAKIFTSSTSRKRDVDLITCDCLHLFLSEKKSRKKKSV